MKKTLLLALFAFTLLSASKAFAGDDVWTMAKSEKYGTKVGGMLGRGVVNVATCFVDVVVQTVNGTQDGPPFVGTLTGLGSGIGCTALRVSSGALDVVTFWVPDFNGIPVSRSYANCLEVEDEVPVAPQAVPAVQPAAVAPAAPAPVVAPEPPAAEKQHDPYEYVKK